MSEYHGKRVQLFSMTGVAMIVVQPEDGLQFRMAGLVCSPTGARVRVIDPAKDCSDGLFECSLAPAADTSPSAAASSRCSRSAASRSSATRCRRRSPSNWSARRSTTSSSASRGRCTGRSSDVWLVH